MKWFSRSQNKGCKSPIAQPQRLLTSWLIKVTLYPLIGSFILSGDAPQWHSRTLASLPLDSIAEKVDRIAAQITVKIYSQEFIGSGIILYQQDGKYLVLTNQHVLRAGTQPFTIQTPDGEIYQSIVLQETKKQNLSKFSAVSQDDLALLSFKSDRDSYQTAVIGDRFKLKEGELIFAAGFPANIELEESSKFSTIPGFSFTIGEVAVVLEKPLQQGYQIAYTNVVKKGMSGGPLLNQQGKVVGVNGRHAYPLWEAPDLYEDNSQPCQQLQDLITRSSLAIPVEKALALASQENIKIEYSDSDPLNLPQKQHIFFKIAIDNSSQVAIEADKTTSTHCP